jgi:hypothetical protein
VVTNGDNDYDPKFLSVLVQQHDAEVVAFDYYSRYQRPTGKQWLCCMACLVCTGGAWACTAHLLKLAANQDITTMQYTIVLCILTGRCA